MIATLNGSFVSLRAYASSMTRTLPSALSRMRLVLVSDPPTTSLMKSAGVLKSTVNRSVRVMYSWTIDYLNSLSLVESIPMSARICP